MELVSNLMQNKTILITGGTGGIGKATAHALAKLNAQVVLIGRNTNRGENTVQEIRGASKNSDIHFLQADLSSQAEVRKVVQNFQNQFGQLHVLINNVAGVFRTRQETVDGIEATFALGHLAPFLLTHLLLPTLKNSTPARIINVASEGHSMAKLDLDDLQAHKFYRAIDIYVRVKLANLMFTYELARRLDGTGITVNAVDPGGAHTQLTDSTTSDMLPPIMKLLYPLVSRFAFTTVEKAAESTIHVTTAPEFDKTTGKYIGTKLEEIKSSKASYDTALTHRLWQISEDLTAIHTSEKLTV